MAVVSREELQAAVENYKAQYDSLQQNLTQAEQAWIRQRDQSVQALHQLQGAMIGLQTVIDGLPENTGPTTTEPVPQEQPARHCNCGNCGAADTIRELTHVGHENLTVA
jgi:hypothetical protein